MRRPHRAGAVVLWGARPGIDLQFGEPADRSRAEGLRRLAELRRAAVPALAAFGRAYRQFGVNAVEAQERMRPAIDALNRLGARNLSVNDARRLQGLPPIDRQDTER